MARQGEIVPLHGEGIKTLCVFGYQRKQVKRRKLHSSDAGKSKKGDHPRSIYDLAVYGGKGRQL